MKNILLCIVALALIGSAESYAQTVNDLMVGDSVRVVWKKYVLRNINGIVLSISVDSVTIISQNRGQVAVNWASIKRIVLYHKASKANNLTSLAAGDLIRIQKEESVLPPQAGRFVSYNNDWIILNDKGRQHKIAMNDILSIEVNRGELKVGGAGLTVAGILVGAVLGVLISSKNESCDVAGSSAVVDAGLCSIETMVGLGLGAGIGGVLGGIVAGQANGYTNVLWEEIPLEASLTILSSKNVTK